MAYRLLFTESYLRIAVRFIKRHPELKRSYANNLALQQRTFWKTLLPYGAGAPKNESGTAALRPTTKRMQE